MIETVGELQEALQELDPNLRLLISTDDANHTISEVHQVSADFVKIRLDFMGFTEDPS